MHLIIPRCYSYERLDDLSDHAAYMVLSRWWENLYKGSYQADKFISYSEVLGGYAPSGLTRKQVSKLNRLVLKTVLFVGTFGKHFGGAASNDPLFWVMHQVFDKMYHALRLSPRYNTRDFYWNNHDQHGKGRSWLGPTPLKFADFEPYLGKNHELSYLGDNEDANLSNEQLWALLKPDGEVLPYIYDQLTHWGTCDFDATAVEVE